MLEGAKQYSKKVGFPKQDIPFKDKDKQWAISNNEYILYQYYENNGIPYSFQDKIDLLRLYAAGKQPTEYYKDVLLGKKKKNPMENDNDTSFNRKGFMNVDFNSIFTVAPKYIYQIRGIFEAQDHEISIQAIDTLSSDKKLIAKEKLFLRKQHADLLQNVQRKDQEDIPLPTDRAELNLYEEMGGFKLQYETAMEKILGFTENYSDYPELKRKIIEDFMVANVAGAMDVYDEGQKVVGVEYIDPKEVIIEYSRDKGFTNSRFAAIPQLYTIVELRAMTDICEEELSSIAGKYLGQYGNPKELLTNYDTWTIPVLHSFWKSVDVESEIGTGTVEINPKKVRASELRSGKIKRVGDRFYKKKKNMLLEKSRIKTVYESQWIIGTKHIFNYRKLKNIPFNYATKDAILPIHLYKLPGTSIVERMKPILDQIQLAFLQLQNIRAKASPDGFSIELGALENVTMGSKKYSPLELIKLRTQTGVLIYRATTAESMLGEGSKPNPISPLNGGYGRMLQDVIQDMELQFQFLADITGIDRMSSVTGAVRTQDSAAATKIAASGTSTSLSPLYVGWLTIKEKLAKSIALRAENICIDNKDKNKGYYNIIGTKGVKAIAEAGKKYPINWGITMIARDKNEDVAEIRNSASRAFELGNIDQSVYLFILNEIKKPYNASYMRHYLALKEGKAKEQQSKAAIESTKALEQKEINVNKIKIQSKIAEIKVQSDADIRLEREKSRLRILETIASAHTDVEKESLMRRLDIINQEIADGLPAAENETQNTPQNITPNQEPIMEQDPSELGEETQTPIME